MNGKQQSIVALFADAASAAPSKDTIDRVLKMIESSIDKETREVIDILYDNIIKATRDYESRKDFREHSHNLLKMAYGLIHSENESERTAGRCLKWAVTNRKY